MNEFEANAALCEVELKKGKNCRVLAIGRCATCEHTFCASHQANSLTSNLCAPCLVQILAEASAPRDYFQSGEARTALLAANVQSVDMYQLEARWEPKKGLFGFEIGRRYINVTVPIGPGWLLGEFRWAHTVFDRESSHSVENDWLTALLDKPNDEHVAQSILYGLNLGLYPVQPCPGGYALISHGSDLADPGSGNNLRAAMQAVKRLTDASS